MNQYEGIIIFKGDLQEKQLEEEYSKVEALINKNEGKIEKTEKWGKKILSYEVKKYKDGFFLYISFQALAKSIKTFTDIFELNNNILRAQIVRQKS